MSKEVNNNELFENESVFKSESEEYIEENSTIFTKKVEPVKQKRVGAGESKKRVLLMAVSFVLIICVAAGIYAVLINYNSLFQGTGSSSSFFGVVAVENDVKTLSSLTVTYQDRVNSYVRSDPNSVTSDGSVNWEIVGVSSNINTIALNLYANQFANFNAVREIEMSEGNDYGFDDPKLVADVKFTDSNANFILTVGNQFSQFGEYYVKINDKCFVMTSAVVGELFSQSTDFVSTTLFTPIDSEDVPEYFNQSVLSYFDYIDVENVNYIDNVHITCNKNDPVYNYYKMTQPYSRYADPEYLNGFFAMFTDGLYASGAFSHTSSSDDIVKYGLDKPIASLAVKIGNFKISMKIGAPIDGFYPVLYGDNEPIYKISVANESMFFVDSRVEDYVSTVTISDYITSISGMRFVFDGFDSKIKLQHDTTDGTFTATVNGNTINSDSVKHLYQHILMIEPNEYIFEANKGETVLKIVLSYVDGSPDKVLEFTVHSEGTRRYVMWLNGEPQSIIRKDFIDNLIDNAPKVVNGEYINSPI